MQLLTRRFPLLILAIGTVALAWAVVREAAQWPIPGHRLATVLYALHLLWIVAETRITVRSSRHDERENDRGTLQLYGIARTVTVVACCFGPAPGGQPHPWLWPAALVFVAGIAIRLAAIRTLGRFYSHRVRRLHDHRIVQTGPYRLVRHPAYLGMAVANTAFVLIFLNPVSAAALVVLLLPALVIRILVEERVLFTISGYRDYAVGRHRLVPFVW